MCVCGGGGGRVFYNLNKTSKDYFWSKSLCFNTSSILGAMKGHIEIRPEVIPRIAAHVKHAKTLISRLNLVVILNLILILYVSNEHRTTWYRYCDK